VDDLNATPGTLLQVGSYVEWNHPMVAISQVPVLFSYETTIARCVQVEAVSNVAVTIAKPRTTIAIARIWMLRIRYLNSNDNDVVQQNFNKTWIQNGSQRLIDIWLVVVAGVLIK